jgi:hypothetical protein
VLDTQAEYERKFLTSSSCPHHRFINHRRVQHVRHIFRGREKDPAICRRDASPRIHPVIANFARQYDVPYHRLHGRFYGTPAKSGLVPGNRRFLDIEEKAICRYLDRLDKLGSPAQRELLRRTADYNYILLANWTPTSTDEKPPSVGQHWVRRFLERHPEYILKRQIGA